MKNNNSRKCNNKLFSTSKFILQTFLSVSTVLVAISFPVKTFGIEINKSIDIDTDTDINIDFSDINLEITDISIDTATPRINFNHQHNTLPDSSLNAPLIYPPNVSIDKTEADIYLDYGSKVRNLDIDDSTQSGIGLPTSPLKFNFTYGSNVSNDQIMGFEMAGKFWSNYLSDDVTLNIFIDSTSELPENVIGGALPGMKSFDYSELRNKYEQDVISFIDYQAFNSLATDITGNNYNVMLNKEEITGINKVNLTRANAKALGLISGEDRNIDGYVMVSNLDNLSGSSSWNYDFENYDVPEDKLDFFSMTVHELGHIMGFVSSGDSSQFKDAINQSKTDNKKVEAKTINQTITLFDLFRYSDKSEGFTNSLDSMQGISDLSIGGNPFMSYDRGDSSIANLSSGEDVNLSGDGYQASHWKQNGSVLGIMDPLLGLGTKRKTTFNDREAMDILGWDLKSSDNSLLFDLFNDIPDFFGSSSRLKQPINSFWEEIFSDAETSFNQKMAFAKAAPDSTDIVEQINRMLEDSDDFYKWSSRNRYSRNGYSQTLDTSDMSGLWQHMTWQKVDFNTSNSVEVKSTPESGSLLGLLGLGLFGGISYSQGFLGRKRNFK